MDSKSEQASKTLPNWTCRLDSNNKKKVTVGDVMFLKCSGLDSVATLPEDSNLKYSFGFENEDLEFALFLLSNTKDEPNEKVFRVTSYYAIKGDAVFKLKIGENDLFLSSPVKLNVETVIKKKQQEPFAPQAPGFIVPGKLQVISFMILVFILIGYSFFRFFKKIRKKSEYKRVLLKSDYPDPYTDFSIDLRNLSKKNQKVSLLFAEECELAFKKFFFRVFKKPVSFESGRKFSFELRRRGVPPHKIRNLYVLQKDYRLILSQKMKEEEIEEFLTQARRISADLKKFLPSEGGPLYA